MGISVCMCDRLLVYVSECVYVYVPVMKAAMCFSMRYAYLFLVNVDITIKLHKFSTISRWIDNDNLHAKNVWQMPPVPTVNSLSFMLSPFLFNRFLAHILSFPTAFFVRLINQP